MHPIDLPFPSLKNFMELVVGTRDYRTFDASYLPLLNKLKELDTAEYVLHIERISNDEYQLWNAVDWRTSYTRHLKQKELARERLAEYDRRDRNIAKLTAAIKEMTGLEQEQCYSMASRIVDTKPAKAKNFGITLEEKPII